LLNQKNEHLPIPAGTETPSQHHSSRRSPPASPDPRPQWGYKPLRRTQG